MVVELLRTLGHRHQCVDRVARAEPDAARLDQRPGDGAVLLRRRTRDQTGGHPGRAERPEAGGASRDRRRRRDDRPGRHLRHAERRRKRLTGVGNPDGDGHRDRRRRGRPARPTRAVMAQVVPARVGDRRRHRRHRRHRHLLQQRRLTAMAGGGGVDRRRRLPHAVQGSVHRCVSRARSSLLVEPPRSPHLHDAHRGRIRAPRARDPAS